MNKFPEIAPSSIEWGLTTSVHYSPSVYENFGQTVELAGPLWRARLSYENLEPWESRPLMAFLAKQRGPHGKFYLWDFSQEEPRGNAAADMNIDGNLDKSFLLQEESGEEPTIRVTNHSDVEYFKEGDWIELRSSSHKPELKMITSQGNPVGGHTFFTFTPPIRNKGYLTLQNVIVRAHKAQSRFMLEGNDQTSWSTSEKIKISDISFGCIEIPES